MLWLDAEAVLHFGEFRRLVPAIQEMNRQGTDQVERMRHRAVLVVALGHVFDTSRSSFETQVLTCELKVSVVGSSTRLTRETTEGNLHGHWR